MCIRDRSWNAQPTCRPRDGNNLLEHNVGHFLITTTTSGLVSHSIDSTIDHAAVVFDDLLDGVALAEVNGCASDLLGLGKTLWHTVDDVNFTGAAEDA